MHTSIPSRTGAPRQPSKLGDAARRLARVALCVVAACGGTEGSHEQPVSGGATAPPPASAAPQAGTSTGSSPQATTPASGGKSAAGASAAPTTAPAGGAGSPATPSAGAAAGGSAGAAGPAPSASPAGAAGADNPSTAGAAGATPAAPSGGAACDRACLTQLNDDYLKALIAHDSTKLPLADNVRFTENGKTLKLSEGLWAVAKSIGEYRQDFAEVPAGQTAAFASLQDDKGTVLVAFRLKVVDRKITEIESTVCRTGEATFFSPNNLKRNPLFDKDLEASKRMKRDELSAIVDLYFQGIESSDGSKIPFDSGARRNENGTNTGMGTGLQNVAMFSYIDKIDRRYVLVDEERGNVLPWILFQIPMGLGGSRTLHLAEAFKVEAGKIMDVQAIMVNQPLGTPSGWE
mgnify:CR=1 FL=1